MNRPTVRVSFEVGVELADEAPIVIDATGALRDQIRTVRAALHALNQECPSVIDALDDALTRGTLDDGSSVVVAVYDASGRVPAVTLAEVERRAMLGALARTEWSVSRAASLLGVGRTTLYRKIQELDLRRDGGPRANRRRV